MFEESRFQGLQILKPPKIAANQRFAEDAKGAQSEGEIGAEAETVREMQIIENSSLRKQLKEISGLWGAFMGMLQLVAVSFDFYV